MKTRFLQIIPITIMILISNLGFLLNISAQTTYTWIGADNGSWVTATNWSPDRTAPANNDILQFNSGTALTITGVVTQTIGNIILTNNSVITLTAIAGRTITVGNQTGTDLTISSGSQLNLGTYVSMTLAAGSSSDISGTLTISAGRTFDTNNSGVSTIVSGSVINNGTFTSAIATVTFQNGSVYQHAVNGGTVNAATWASNSTCILSGMVANDPLFGNVSYGNIIWNCPNQTATANFTVTTIQSNLIIENSGTGIVFKTSNNLSIGGNYSQSGGYFRVAAGIPRIITITGNFSLNGGTLDMCSGTAGSDLSTLNVAGDFSHTAGTLTVSSTGSGRGEIYFNGTNPQNYTSGGIVSGRINFTVNNGASLMTETSLLGDGSTGTFTLLAGGTLGIGDAAGIATSGTTGNIRVTGTRNFNNGANYIYNGTGTQTSGNGLPLTVNSFTLGGTSDFTFTNNPSFATPFTVTNNCSIGTGTILTIGSSQGMTVGGTLTNNAGTGGLVIKSDASGTGSLINSTAGVNAKVERYLTQNVWHYTSSPVSSALSGVFTDIYLRSFNEATDDWNPHIISTTFPLSVMMGYAAWVPGSNPMTVTFEGPLNTGSQSINVTRNITQTDQGWNLVGNPYPSSLDWDAVSGWTKTNVNNTIYYYSGNGGLSNYKYYIGSGGETPGVGTSGATNEIPAMQGFFVHASADGSLSVNNDARIHSAQAYYKGSNKNEIPLIRLQAEGNGLNDETVIRFYSGAEMNFDGDHDAYKLFGDGHPQMYSITQDQTELAISTLPGYDEETVIPIGFMSPLEGEYSISLTELIEFESGTSLYLEDIQTGIIRKITEEPVYAFTSSPMDDHNRFLLHFSNPLGVENLSTNPISVYAYDNTVYVQLSDRMKSQIAIYNLMGQLILNQQSEGQDLVRLKLDAKTGYYLVKVQTSEQFVKEKIFIK